VKNLIWGMILLTVAGCASDGGNYRNVESSPQDWVLPGPKTEEKVFGPMPYDEVEHFVHRQESDGWNTVKYEPAGHPLDGQYLVIMRHWR
jgi:hypothetical protein